MHAKSPAVRSPASISNQVASASGLTTGATAARIESAIRLSLRHDDTICEPKKAAIAFPARDHNVVSSGAERAE
jgi:hypothetical protein